VVRCSRVGFRAAVFAPGGQSARRVRTVRVVLFGPGVLGVLRMFLRSFVSIRLASGFWWKVVWWIVCQDVADSSRGTSCSRTVRGRGTDRPRVAVGSFC
jgi:hypothetical protein